MYILKYVTALLLASVFIVGCNESIFCHNYPSVTHAMPIDEYIKRTGVVAVPVSEAEYNAVVNDETIKTVLYASAGSASLVTHDIITFHRMYTAEKLVCYMTPIIDINSYSYMEIVSSHSCKQFNSYLGFTGGTFTKGKAFKVDKDNWDHFYLYYNDSWWMWDISILNMNFDDKRATSCGPEEFFNDYDTANIKFEF